MSRVLALVASPAGQRMGMAGGAGAAAGAPVSEGLRLGLVLSECSLPRPEAGTPSLPVKGCGRFPFCSRGCQTSRRAACAEDTPVPLLQIPGHAALNSPGFSLGFGLRQGEIGSIFAFISKSSFFMANLPYSGLTEPQRLSP